MVVYTLTSADLTLVTCSPMSPHFEYVLERSWLDVLPYSSVSEANLRGLLLKTFSALPDYSPQSQDGTGSDTFEQAETKTV